MKDLLKLYKIYKTTVTKDSGLKQTYFHVTKDLHEACVEAVNAVNLDFYDINWFFDKKMTSAHAEYLSDDIGEIDVVLTVPHISNDYLDLTKYKLSEKSLASLLAEALNYEHEDTQSDYNAAILSLGDEIDIESFRSGVLWILKNLNLSNDERVKSLGIPLNNQGE